MLIFAKRVKRTIRPPGQRVAAPANPRHESMVGSIRATSAKHIYAPPEQRQWEFQLPSGNLKKSPGAYNYLEENPI